MVAESGLHVDSVKAGEGNSREAIATISVDAAVEPGRVYASKAVMESGDVIYEVPLRVIVKK